VTIAAMSLPLSQCEETRPSYRGRDGHADIRVPPFCRSVKHPSIARPIGIARTHPASPPLAIIRRFPPLSQGGPAGRIVHPW